MKTTMMMKCPKFCNFLILPEEPVQLKQSVNDERKDSQSVTQSVVCALIMSVRFQVNS